MMSSRALIVSALFFFLPGLPADAGERPAGLRPTAPGFTIPNSHLVDPTGRVIRGMAPGARAAELPKNGVTDVLIFKEQVRNEVAEEVQALERLGYKPAQIHHIPMGWQNIGPFRPNCEKVVGALRLLARVRMSRSRKIYFHCTAGEDRTGLLAGLYRVLGTPKAVPRIFAQELCAHGYEAGDPGKPAAVVNDVRRQLTPLFLKISYLIATGKLSPRSLDPRVCASDPADDPNFQKLVLPTSSRFVCGRR